MTLTRRLPDAELQVLLNRFEAMGGVVEWIFIDGIDGRTAEDELHRQAAIFFLQTLKQESDEYFERVAAAENRSRADYFSLAYQPELAQGRPIGLLEFFGPGFDIPSQRLILRGKSPGRSNEYFLAGDAETASTVITLQNCRSHFIINGYAQAFSDPPYGMQASHTEINELFLAINRRVFLTINAELVIYEWSTDWSNYFEAGKEWWGGFLWTVHAPQADFMVALGASATD